MNISNVKILFIQRVITNYRLDLIKELCNSFKQVGILTSKGIKSGTLKIADTDNVQKKFKNLKIYIPFSFTINYKGESRSTNLFIYPKSLQYIKEYDVIVLEGTTNILNNIYIIPFAKLLGKKMIWWDAGYSIVHRSLRRKVIDFFLSPFVRLTNAQMSYSSLANNYMKHFMGAKNAFVNLNTINTNSFKKIKSEIFKNNETYNFNRQNIRLLYVGVVEKRKKIKELIEIVQKLNKPKKRFELQIIGGGQQLEKLKEYTKAFDEITLFGPIYNKNELKLFYFNSDLFILPGDGGLAILQSLLFGLPVICVKGADGTESDYITHKPFLLNNLNELPNVLENLVNINRKKIYNNNPDFSSEKWIEVFEKKVTELIN